MRLSEIPAVLREIGVSPVKTLGQNFLHDSNLARWIVDQAKLTPNDYVAEIGPGLGALTEIALAKGARLLAIEKDKRLASFLRERFQGKPIEIVHGDALEFDTRVLYAQPQVKLLGNLPYYISSQLLIRFLKYPSPISLWLFMLQKELARRMGAAPATSDYGALTLQIQLHYHVEYLRTIPATVFLPKPDVDSAIVRIVPRSEHELLSCNQAVFQTLVRRGFSQRRKQLRKLLREEAPNWETIVAELGINPHARAEELSLTQWVALVNHISPSVPARAGQDPEEQFQVVDDQDRPAGVASRGELHGNNLLHRAVHVFIFNSEEEIFLQFRSKLKDRHPLTWDSSAAGHVNATEGYDQTATRELREELGVEAALKRVAKLTASERTDFEFICLYVGSYSGALRPNPAEIEAGRFFPLGIVDQWTRARPTNFAPGFLACWNVYREEHR
jgi:16S rRNA (adenine1518-N6/adenine1519-N6)-dimethyltransferase